MKKLLAWILSFSFVFATLITPVSAQNTDQMTNSSNESIEKETDKAMGIMGTNVSDDIITFGTKTLKTATPSAPQNTIGKGVDISKYNWPPNKSKDIDFSKLSKSVDFVIIRCGYGQDIESQDDAFFEKSVKACEKYGIPYGIYLYSYATTESKAVGEANHTLRCIQEAGANPTLPVFLDMEDDSQSGIGAANLAKVAKKYCSVIEKAGYTTGIYASTYWWNNKLTNSYFNSTIKWVAQYNSTCTYKKSYAIWQCSSTATVSGITGVVDLNYMIEDIYLNTDITATGYSGTYDGKDHTITVSNYKEGTDVQYSTDNVNWSTTNPVCKDAGTTIVYYKAINKAGKEVSGNEKITIKERSISNTTISSVADKVYTGSQIKPAVTVKYNGTTLIDKTDYTVSYGTNKSTGAATVTVTGKGNFTDSKTITFYIVPKQVTGVTTAKGTKSKSATVKWTKTTGATGYQIAYSRKGKNSWSYVTVTTNSKTFNGLAVKSYNVKVRAYKTVNGVKKYGAYSTVKIMTAK